MEAVKRGGKSLYGLSQFLDDYPGMSTSPCIDAGVCLRGKFRFKANVPGRQEIEDSYKLEMVVPYRFPRALPVVKETGGKIPRANGDFHAYQDGTLCLGSPLTLLKTLYSSPDLNGFADKCLIPYLYAVSLKLMDHGKFVFGELPHGDPGIIEDYSMIFGLSEQNQIKKALLLLGTKKRIANKKLCPCGCKKRLGSCRFHYILNDFRKMAPVSWFQAHALNDWNRL